MTGERRDVAVHAESEEDQQSYKDEAALEHITRIVTRSRPEQIPAHMRQRDDEVQGDCVEPEQQAHDDRFGTLRNHFIGRHIVLLPNSGSGKQTIPNALLSPPSWTRTKDRRGISSVL